VTCFCVFRLKLKTIISLLPSEPTADLEDFCAQQDITHLWYHVEKMKDEVTMSRSLVATILEICIDPKRLPLLIHCPDGANITGIVIMCLRKLQNWNLSASTTEFTRFTRAHSILSVESEFAETFKAEIKVPLEIPKWLWQGNRDVRHPTLKLKLIKPPEEEFRKANGTHMKRKSSRMTAESGNQPDLSLLDTINLRVSRDVEALDLELNRWEKTQNKDTPS